MKYTKKSPFLQPLFPPFFLVIIITLMVVIALVGGCKKTDKPRGISSAQVTVVKVEPEDTPFIVEYIGQTQSSHQVEIRARVNGFLDKRVYVEGGMVGAGDVMFQMDPKPFQAQLDAALGALSQQQARLTTARANLARVKPLAELNALSQRDLDDATGQEQTAAAAVETAKAEVAQARLNLSYATITSPVTGFSSYARVQEGAYISPQNNLLTYVYRTDPIWIDFSLSESDTMKAAKQVKQGKVRLPKGDQYMVEVVLADGSLYPKRGKIFFADAEYNHQTGTFLLRCALPNPENILKPGQFVRVRLLGITLLKAIVVPQRAVQQGAKGHFVWVVDNENKAGYRPVTVGEWTGDNWIIDEGLHAGDMVVVDGGLTLRDGIPVEAKALTAPDKEAPAQAAPEEAGSGKDGARGRK